MDISIKSLALFGAVVLTGLSAGLFYAWSVSVIPGTQKISDSTYLETMQSINRAILNPAFFLIFFGSVLFLGFATIYAFQASKLMSWVLLAAALIYLIGTIGITSFGNVPLNNQLDALKLTEIGIDELVKFRKFYEQQWNRLHHIRTVFAVLSFILSVIALFLQTKKF